MTERDSFKTLNGKYSSLCHSCGRIAYNLWIDNRPPPWGCAEGHDDAIWKCGLVYTALVSMVIGIDHFNRPPDERQEALLQSLGDDRVASMFAHIRSGKEPPHHRPREPVYDQPLMS